MAKAKPKTKKTEELIEAVAARGLDQVTTELGALQSTVRAALSEVAEALMLKKQELEAIGMAIEDKRSELDEWLGKEKAGLSLKELREEAEDARHAHERDLALMEGQMKMRREALEQELEQRSRERREQWGQESRERQIALEDEDIERRRAFAQTEAELAVVRGQLEQEKGELEQQKKAAAAEVEKRVAIRSRELDLERKAAMAEMNAKIAMQAQRNDDLQQTIIELRQQLDRAQERARLAEDRAQAVAVASLDAESGKKALDELRTISHKQAESGKR